GHGLDGLVVERLRRLRPEAQVQVVDNLFDQVEDVPGQDVLAGAKIRLRGRAGVERRGGVAGDQVDSEAVGRRRRGLRHVRWRGGDPPAPALDQDLLAADDGPREAVPEKRLVGDVAVFDGPGMLDVYDCHYFLCWPRTPREARSSARADRAQRAFSKS